MKHVKIFLTLALFIFMAQAHGGDKAAKQFEKIKSLAGEWQGEGDHGTVNVSYEVVSNGSVVMERMQQGNEPEMVTMYHLDGNTLMMTHYCSTKNQPRMRAESGSDGNTIQFSKFDATNLAKPTDGHMGKMVLTFKDDNHIAHKWTFFQDAEKAMDVPIELERKNSKNKS